MGRRRRSPCSRNAGFRLRDFRCLIKRTSTTWGV
jgi:hypothetical protein